MGSLHLEELQAKLRGPDCQSVFSAVFHVHDYVLNCVRLIATPWIVAHQAPLSMGFPRQEYWIGLPFPSPGDRLAPGIEPGSLALHTDSLPSEPPVKTLLLRPPTKSSF